MDNSFKNLLSDMWPIFHKTTLILSEKKKQMKKNLKKKKKFKHESVKNLWRSLRTKLVVLVDF
jgi:hypothetical protein